MNEFERHGCPSGPQGPPGPPSPYFNNQDNAQKISDASREHLTYDMEGRDIGYGSRVVDNCHKYVLSNGDYIEFVQKLWKPDEEGNTFLICDIPGTTNEEIINLLIHRLSVLNKQIPCRENSLAITKLEEALMWLEKRTLTRVQQNVEATDQPHK